MAETPENKDLYKDTVFLPKTDFPMRGELPKREPEILKKWQDMDFYNTQRKASKGRPKWVLHWGPPYANGHAHMGHAFTKTLKDVVNRSWQMMGYDAPLVPGWDCHGLPIEWKIEEKYRAGAKNANAFDKNEIDPIVFRAECRAFAKMWADTQSQEFQRIGVNADWANPYLTMTKPAEAQIVREIHKFLLNGLLYKGVKPVMWSTVEQTALAEAEVEYKEHKSITVWVKFPILPTHHKPLEGASVVIWTTTPWTLPSNRAIAFGKNIEYALYDVKAVAADSKAKVGDRLLLAVGLAEDVKAKAKIEAWEEEFTLKGAELDGLACAHPLRGQGYDFDVRLLAGDFVTADTGTGFVHMAPGHGEDDYYLFISHFSIKDIPDNVTDDGKFRDHVPLFAGKEILTQKGEMGDGNFAVLKALDEAGALLAKGSLKHEYPHSWRSKAPVIFRTTPQWFIALDELSAPSPLRGEGGGEGAIASIVDDVTPSPNPLPAGERALTLRQKALTAISETRWVPPQGENRIRAMIEQRPDWCISRQRTWGVPIALFIAKKDGQPLKDTDVLKRIGDTFEAEGSDAWWQRDAQYFLGDKYKADDYTQVFDIVDVWFESGCTHAFVLEQRPELKWPADLYLEGSDQHRGWFHSSLLESCGTRGRAPYDTVLTHGFVLDEKGYKMSKSLGNVVDPADMIAQYGADIVRLWALLSDYNEDIRIGKDTIKNTSDLYRRLRNTFRYLLGALDSFTDAERVTDIEQMPELERLVLHWLHELNGEIRDHIKNYQFGKLAHRLHNFCAIELSAFYFDIRKDSLYCDRPDDIKRRACRTVMAHLFDCLTAWLAPILAFTAEEAWSHRPASISKENSVHLRVFPQISENWKNEKLKEKWIFLQSVRDEVLATIEPKRKDKTLGSSLEAHPHLYLMKDIGIFKEYFSKANMDEICITSGFTIHADGASKIEGNRLLQISTEISLAEGNKCARCWKILPEVGSDSEQPDLCNRCADAVRHSDKNRKAA